MADPINLLPPLTVLRTYLNLAAIHIRINLRTTWRNKYDDFPDEERERKTHEEKKNRKETLITGWSELESCALLKFNHLKKIAPSL